MAPYWVLFLIPALASLAERSSRALTLRRPSAIFVFVLISIWIMIGLRYQVGGDWGNYLRQFDEASLAAFGQLLLEGDPGYRLLSWLTARLGADIWLVNLVCGALFCFGLALFVRVQPRPWLALTIAIPYLVIVVAMGYTRQSVAIGFIMAGIVSLVQNRSTRGFVFYTLLGATFHKSAVLMIPIAAFASGSGRLWRAAWVAVATAISYFTLLESSVDTLVSGYFGSEYQSQGALIRILMNAFPAAIFVLFRGRFDFSATEKRVWLIMSGLSLLSVPALAISSSSTAVDRLGLYLIPLQLVVLSRIPNAFSRSAQGGQLLSFGVAGYLAAVQFVWLIYADNSSYWVPYQFYLLH